MVSTRKWRTRRWRITLAALAALTLTISTVATSFAATGSGGGGGDTPTHFTVDRLPPGAHPSTTHFRIRLGGDTTTTSPHGGGVTTNSNLAVGGTWCDIYFSSDLEGDTFYGQSSVICDSTTQYMDVQNYHDTCGLWWGGCA